MIRCCIWYSENRGEVRKKPAVAGFFVARAGRAFMLARKLFVSQSVRR
jgi:hypothetical protein